jgi:hypothetical protein
MNVYCLEMLVTTLDIFIIIPKNGTLIGISTNVFSFITVELVVTQTILRIATTAITDVF